MRNKIGAWIADRKQDQRGVTLIEVVFALALFVAVGFSFVYASSVIDKTSKHSLEQAKSTIGQSGISNSFRMDVSNAKAVRINDLGSSLDIARSNGSCVRWVIQSPVDSPDGKLFRSVAEGAAVLSAPGSELVDGIETGSLSISGSNVSLNLDFASGGKFRETVGLNIAGTDGGECW